MRGTPGAARVHILCAALCAALCAVPALSPGAGTPWGTLGLLAALSTACELPGRCRFFGRAVPVGAGSFFPVLLTAAFLLPPSAAVLVAVPGALAGRVDRPPVTARRLWRAAQLALTVGAASWTYAILGGPATLGGASGGTVPDLPYALVPACAAALVFSLVLAALDGGIRVTAERVAVRHAWRGLPARSVGPHLVHALAGLMMAVLWRSTYGPLSALVVLLPMYISCWVFAQYHRRNAAHRATIRALVQAVDIKDGYTRGHSERVGRASELIARELGMEESRMEALRFAGILHDVGKLGVPTRILRKDGPLTPEERRVIELHPEYGHEIVRGIGFLDEARAAILHHHERLDGSGYPYGLAGDGIPEFARVVAVADAFDAMTSTRSYRRGRPVPAAVEELRRCAGSQFDPRMVRALARALDRHGWSAAANMVTSDEERPGLPTQRAGSRPPATGSPDRPGQPR
ncbi:HD-GYP domain-containing protein [Streptomyces sp. HB132]|uniref:HD-GYP domain-containing protein n=1 Tax=Streptomyces sp. HB132 TaxID=767388 RepID=UPI001961FD0B|nr:HD-GYP domain-containing protein [Streptomyces sp. HB132]MBM7441233.1 putative nucleotidyltransferase with HDIG domain [Streptomyces sp. HB132]